MVAKDEKVYDEALTQALQYVMGRGKTTFLEAMLGLHWALAKKLFMSGKQTGIDQAMNDLENLEIGPQEDTTPKGLQRPPPREKRPKKKGKGK